MDLGRQVHWPTADLPKSLCQPELVEHGDRPIETHEQVEITLHFGATLGETAKEGGARHAMGPKQRQELSGNGVRDGQ